LSPKRNGLPDVLSTRMEPHVWVAIGLLTTPCSLARPDGADIGLEELACCGCHVGEELVDWQ
jgi:hypothetical protein